MYSSGTGAIFLETVYETALGILTDFDDYKLSEELKFVA